MTTTLTRESPVTETGRMTIEEGDDSPKIIFLADNPYDIETTQALLREYGLGLHPASDLARVVDELDDDPDCLVLVEEGLRSQHFDFLLNALENQPAWSDLPILVITRGDSSSHRAWQLMQVANVTLVERPLHTDTLVSLIRSALRDRSRQHEIRQSITNRDRFLSMVGHELRNPLTSIKLALDLIDDADNPALTIIRNQYRNLERIVDDIRDLGQISQGVITFDKERLDLADLVDETVDAFASIAEQEGLDLHTELPDIPIWVHGDPVRLAQVLGNLLSNAIRYTPEGGYIEVETRLLGEIALVTVRDSGIGIPPEELSNIFDLFTRIQSRRKGGEDGLGLGLNLAHSIVKAHEGHLVATSEGRDMGSEFSLYLPTTDPPPKHTDGHRAPH
jgi:signal transduction histidine kinase